MVRDQSIRISYEEMERLNFDQAFIEDYQGLFRTVETVINGPDSLQSRLEDIEQVIWLP